jgi:hypothetical protein
VLDIKLILIYLLLDFSLDLVDAPIVFALQLGGIVIVVGVIAKQTFLCWPEDLSYLFQPHSQGFDDAVAVFHVFIDSGLLLHQFVLMQNEAVDFFVVVLVLPLQQR